MNKEIVWHIVNSLLAGFIFAGGALIDGEITLKGIFISIILTLVTAAIKFQDYWKTEEKEWTNIMTFIH